LCDSLSQPVPTEEAGPSSSEHLDARHQEEAALLALYARGDPHAAGALIAMLGPRLLAYCRRILGGDMAEAEDVLQEIMLRLWRLAPGWVAGQARVSTWAYQVATNLCTDRLRRHGRRAMSLDEGGEPPSSAAPVEAVILAGQRVLALDQALAALPERQRQAVVLRHIEGMTNPEIATIMGLGVEAVESLTARGRRALQSILSGQRDALGFHDEEARDV
jgi:RNA polymerase sigma factor (sigma-70 family)